MRPAGFEPTPGTVGGQSLFQLGYGGYLTGSVGSLGLMWMAGSVRGVAFTVLGRYAIFQDLRLSICLAARTGVPVGRDARGSAAD